MTKNDLPYINLCTTSELSRDEALALWKKVILESDIENYLEHYKDEKNFVIFHTRIETDFPKLAEALNDENESHVESILYLGNEVLRNIKIEGYRTPKRGYLSFSDKQRLKAIALSLHSEEETKRADAKKAAIAKQQGDQGPTLEEVLDLEDYAGEEEIVNYVVLKKVVNDIPQNFYIKISLEDGEIVQKLVPSRAIPIQTAPSLDFYTRDYNSLQDLYGELRKAITDYVAFPTDSIAPDLIALGSVATYFREVFYTFPFLDYTSSEPESGKTTAMKVQTFTSFYGTIASSVTEALLFREIDDAHCFYGLDNLERLFAKPKDYTSIIDWLLSSSSRDIPCKRLEKTEEGFKVREFDGYGMKAFTHIRNFPLALRALRSRCIQIIMQTGKPKRFYPSADKFTEIRDALYKVRLNEFEAVNESYDQLINTNVLTGRTSDLYYPLLSIAKLVDEKLYQRVLHYAVTDEVERKEMDSWNIVLIQVLLDKELFGSHSTNEIRGFYEEALIKAGLLKDSTLHTRTVTMRLKKLGFQREEKKTENKTWFLISREQLISKAQEYNILEEDELKKYVTVPTPQNPNFPNLSNFGEGGDNPKEGSTGGSGEDKPSTEEIDLGSNGCDEELTKVGKLAKRGVCEDKIKCISPVEKATCEQCGEERFLDHVWEDGEQRHLICAKCAEEMKNGKESKKENEEAEVRSGISKGLDVEYVDLSKCNFTEVQK